MAPTPTSSPGNMAANGRRVRFAELPQPELNAGPRQGDPSNQSMRPRSDPELAYTSNSNDPVGGADNSQSPPQPFSAEEIRQSHAMRRMYASSLMHMTGLCRVATQYHIVGWAGTLPEEGRANAHANSRYHQETLSRLVVLEAALRPFAVPTDPEQDHCIEGAMWLSMMDRIDSVRVQLLRNPMFGARACQYIGGVLDLITRYGYETRILAPQEQQGWAWSWPYDDWFRWNNDEKKWISTLGLRVDNLMV